jgi:hypothetical protein
VPGEEVVGFDEDGIEFHGPAAGRFSLPAVLLLAPE